MDFGAFMVGQQQPVAEYIKKNYGEVPRIRGVRFMKLEKPVPNEEKSPQIDMFNKYCGQDVVYIHTRCGDCSMSLGFKSKNSNYFTFGAKAWEERNKKLFLDHITDEFDCTYCDHYFKAVVNDEYADLIKRCV
jgi:hypothetical protein